LEARGVCAKIRRNPETGKLGLLYDRISENRSGNLLRCALATFNRTHLESKPTSSR